MVVRRLTPMECISIHAPARGATRGGLVSVVAQYVISIHAPARGATGEVELVAGVVLKFQSTPPRGGATICV